MPSVKRMPRINIDSAIVRAAAAVNFGDMLGRATKSASKITPEVAMPTKVAYAAGLVCRREIPAVVRVPDGRVTTIRLPNPMLYRRDA